MGFNFKKDLSDPVSQVRQLIGDTDATNALYDDDATIVAYLVGRNPTAAAAALAYDLAARFASKVSTENDRLRQANSDLFKHFTALGDRLSKGPTMPAPTTGVVAFGGPVVTGLECPVWSPRDCCDDRSY